MLWKYVAELFLLKRVRDNYIITALYYLILKIKNNKKPEYNTLDEKNLNKYSIYVGASGDMY